MDNAARCGAIGGALQQAFPGGKKPGHFTILIDCRFAKNIQPIDFPENLPVNLPTKNIP